MILLVQLSAMLVISNPNGSVREYRHFRTMERCEEARAEMMRRMRTDLVIICVRKD